MGYGYTKRALDLRFWGRQSCLQWTSVYGRVDGDAEGDAEVMLGAFLGAMLGLSATSTVEMEPQTYGIPEPFSSMLARPEMWRWMDGYADKQVSEWLKD